MYGKENGEITGLRARGAFEIISLKWKERKIESLMIKSTLEENLRLRVHNELKFNNNILSKAKSENKNPLFAKQQIAPPLISEKAPLKGIALKHFYLYDISTEAGQVYTLTTF